jgi:hypothetical protein
MEYLYIDSTNRDTKQYPDYNAFVLYLTSPIKTVHSVKLLSAKVPNTVYNINTGVNVFSFNGNTYSILPGFYSAYGLAVAMSATTAGSLTISYLEDQASFLFSASSPFTMSFNTAEIRLCCGITSTGTLSSFAASSNPVYQNDVTYSSKYIILSQIVVDFTTIDAIFLDIEEFRTTQVVDSKSLNTLYNQSFVGNSIERVTAVIPMDVDSGKIKYYKDAGDFTMHIKMNTPLQNLQRVTVNLRDKNGQIVNFNGYNNNSFLLEING